MWIRSLMLMFAVGCAAMDSADDEVTAAVEQNSTGGFQCRNGDGVICVGQIAILPINVDIKNVRILNNSELSLIEDSLNNLAILDGGILDNGKILNDVELTVLTDFLEELDLDVTKNDINVCTSVLGLLLCR